MAWYLAAPPIRTEASRERKYISGADGNRGEIAAPSFSTRHISLRIIVSSRGCKTRFQAFVRDFRRYKWGGIGRRAAQGSMRPTVRNKARSRTKKKKLIEIKQRLGSDWLGSKRFLGLDRFQSLDSLFRASRIGRARRKNREKFRPCGHTI